MTGSPKKQEVDLSALSPERRQLIGEENLVRLNQSAVDFLVQTSKDNLGFVKKMFEDPEQRALRYMCSLTFDIRDQVSNLTPETIIIDEADIKLLFYGRT